MYAVCTPGPSFCRSAFRIVVLPVPTSPVRVMKPFRSCTAYTSVASASAWLSDMYRKRGSGFTLNGSASKPKNALYTRRSETREARQPALGRGLGLGPELRNRGEHRQAERVLHVHHAVEAAVAHLANHEQREAEHHAEDGAGREPHRAVRADRGARQLRRLHHAEALALVVRLDRAADLRVDLLQLQGADRLGDVLVLSLEVIELGRAARGVLDALLVLRDVGLQALDVAGVHALLDFVVAQLVAHGDLFAGGRQRIVGLRRDQLVERAQLLARVNDVGVLLGLARREQAVQLELERALAHRGIGRVRRRRGAKLLDLLPDQPHLVLGGLGLRLGRRQLDAVALESVAVQLQLLGELALVVLLVVTDLARDVREVGPRLRQLLLEELGRALGEARALSQVRGEEGAREAVGDLCGGLRVAVAERDLERVQLDRLARVDDRRRQRIERDLLAHRLDLVFAGGRRALEQMEVTDHAGQAVAREELQLQVLVAGLGLRIDRRGRELVRDYLRLDGHGRDAFVDRGKREREHQRADDCDAHRHDQPPLPAANYAVEVADAYAGFATDISRGHPIILVVGAARACDGRRADTPRLARRGRLRRTSCHKRAKGLASSRPPAQGVSGKQATYYEKTA